MTWTSNPLKNKIIVALIKRKGEIIDDDLMRLLFKGDSASHQEALKRELMSLEIQGVVNISQITRTRKRIKLVNPERLNPDILGNE